jgi:hypothetical protein
LVLRKVSHVGEESPSLIAIDRLKTRDLNKIHRAVRCFWLCRDKQRGLGGSVGVDGSSAALLGGIQD